MTASNSAKDRFIDIEVMNMSRRVERSLRFGLTGIGLCISTTVWAVDQNNDLKEGVSILVQHVRAPKHVLVPNAYRMLYTMPMVAAFVKKNGLELVVQSTLDHVILFVLVVMDLALKTAYFVLLEPR